MAALGSQQNWSELQQVPLYSLPLHVHSLPFYQYPPPEWYLCQNQWAYIDRSLSPKSIAYTSVHTPWSAFYEFGQTYIYY